jgi:probable F420-dependent oxidoreductase
MAPEGRMKLGLWLPVHHLTPPLESEWERTGSVEDVACVVRDADELGFDFVCCAEHVALPVSRERVRGNRYWDPLGSLGYMAAITARLSLVPFVVVLGYHHPLAIAKRYGTLDLLSTGRLILGVGVGSLVEEFDLLGASFPDRGARADEALLALAAARGIRVPQFHGKYYDYDGMIVEPGLGADTPFWVGGGSARALRRAVEHAEAWTPVNIEVAEVRGLLSSSTTRSLIEQRDRPLDIILANIRLDPLGDPDEARTLLEELNTAGITGIVPRIPSRSPDHLIEQHHRLYELSRG